MMDIIVFIALVLWNVPDNLSQNVPESAACYSRFDYESKMLERIVLVEHRMNLLQDSTTRDLEKFQSAIRHMKKEQNTKMHEMTKSFEKLEERLQTAQRMKLDELTSVGDDLKNMSDNLLLDHELKEKELERTFNNMSDLLKEEISKKHTEVVSDLKKFTNNLEAKHVTKLDEMTTVEKDLREMSDSLKEEQAVKLLAVEAIGDEIKLEIQERMLKLEAADRSQQLEYDKVYQEFEEKVNRTWNEIEVSGLNIKPTVAFNIRDVANSRPNSGNTLRFSYVLLNTDSVYDSSTGIFTVPVTGTYWFSVQMCGIDNNAISFRIMVNDQAFSDSTTIRQSNTCTTSNAVATLNDGDKVCVKAEHSYRSGFFYSGDLIRSSAHTRSAFMGSLVH